MLLTVDVTQADIDAGTPKAKCGCPIALALDRAGHAASIIIDDQQPSVGCVNVFISGLWADLPDEASCFVDRFDAGRSVQPFTFTLDLKAD